MTVNKSIVIDVVTTTTWQTNKFTYIYIYITYNIITNNLLMIFIFVLVVTFTSIKVDVEKPSSIFTALEYKMSAWKIPSMLSWKIVTQ